MCGKVLEDLTFKPLQMYSGQDVYEKTKYVLPKHKWQKHPYRNFAQKQLAD